MRRVGSGRVAALACALLGVLASGCGREPGESPPEILYGQHECDHCRMILSEERTASAGWAEDGARRFDDLACLRAWWAEAEGDAARVWVHDASTLEWLRATEAVYVRVPELVTPMGSGWLAVADAAASEGLPAEVAAGPMGWTDFTNYTEGDGAERSPSR